MLQSIYKMVGGLADDMKSVKNDISGLHNKVDKLEAKVDRLDEENKRDHEGFQALLETIANYVGKNHEKRITKLEKMFKN